MSNYSKYDIAKSLPELSDEDAKAIMEGRVPMAETLETNEVAHELVVKALEDALDSNESAVEQSAQPTERASSSVVQLITGQPWMRMAAALVAGIALASIVSVPRAPIDAPESAAALASTNVAYLEVMRSSGSIDVPVLEVSPSETWLTLIAYPNFADAEQMNIQVERALSTTGAEVSWQTVMEQTTGVGSRDSLVVTVPMASIENGLYRLRMDSVRQADVLERSTMEFRVQLQAE